MKSATVGEVLETLMQLDPDLPMWMEGEYDLVPVYRVELENTITGPVAVIH